jgi:alkyl hydroperoxide reductase subunit AhpC
MHCRRIFFIAAFAVTVLPSLCLAYGLKIGAAAPFFKVSSGDGQVLTLEDIKGKATGIFYETTDVVEQNRELKGALSKYYDAQPEGIRRLIVRLAAINCSRVFLPLRGIWRSEFRKHSRIENITIYGDWSGKMFSDYDIEDAQSNVFLVDKKGIVRYYSAGKIEGKEIGKVVSLFKKLVEE